MIDVFSFVFTLPLKTNDLHWQLLLITAIHSNRQKQLKTTFSVGGALSQEDGRSPGRNFVSVTAVPLGQ